MQVRQGPTKPKYKISDFTVPGNAAINKQTFSLKDQTCKLNCICKKFFKHQAIQCSRCFAYVHRCLLKEIPAKKDWECLHCSSVFLDPVFSVGTILLETMFKTEYIFQYMNQIQFQFELTEEQMKNPVELRGLQEGRDGLAWPMQGELLLNKTNNSEPFFSFKPLLANSNRKHRKQEPIMLPVQLLQVGRNVLEFRIPKLNIKTFKEKYQYEERAAYYFGIYAINKLSKDQLVSKTFKTSQIQKQESLQFLKKLTGSGDPELTVEKVKLNLECPYSKLRIKVPVRGKKCPHYTCLCLQTLIQTRATMPTRQWSCPICDNKVNEPIIDMFVLSILNDGTGGIQVMLSVTGQYEWLAYNNDSDSDDDSIVIKKPVVKDQQKKLMENSNSLIVGNKTSGQVLKKDRNSQNPINIKNNSNSKPIVQINLDDDSPPIIVSKTPNKNSVNIDLDDDDPLPQIVIPKDIPLNREQMHEIDRQKVREALKKKREKGPSSPQRSQFKISDVKVLEFRTMNLKEYHKYFNIEYQPRASKVADDINLMFAEFRDIL